MQLHSVQLDAFRNLASQEVELAAGLNLLVGDNGQGKTNLLEAVHLLASLRSFRPATVREMIRHGSERAELRATLSAAGAPLALKLVLEPGGRRLWVGQRQASSVADYLGRLSVVAFTPDDLAMVKGGPATRRRFLDRAAFLFQPAHLQSLKAFSAALKARNRLLSEPAAPDRLQIESFGRTLAEHGARVTRTRRALVERLAPAAGELLSELSGGRLTLGLALRPGWRPPAEEAAGPEALERQLAERLAADLRRGQTGLGPQLDDLQIDIDGQPARRYASQGQQRALALALLLAVVVQTGPAGIERPVLLLDDVSSELDSGVRRRLFERVRAAGSQVLVTTTDEALGGELFPERLFRVTAGRLELQAGAQP